MYQFTQLLASHLPEVSAHLENLGIQPTYASQWFLSFFAVTCPLPMLFRIYDVIFAEGAPETIMRVALSLMRRNQKRLLAATEFEDVLQMLLARSLWDVFRCNADDLVQDFVGLSGIVTRDALAELEAKFKGISSDDSVKPTPAKPQASDLQAAASRFLGRLWGGTPQAVTLSVPSRPPSSILMQRSPSKQSLSTLNSFDVSDAGSHSTDATTMSQCSSISEERRLSTRSFSSKKANKDLELHNQIEDLLVALSGLQREHAMRMDELQAVRESREAERKLAKRLIELLGNGSQDEEESVNEISDLCDRITDVLDKEESEESIQASRSANAHQAEELRQAREQLSREMLKSRNLANRLAEQDADVVRLKSQLLDTRGKWQDIQKENQQLQKSLSDLRRGGACPGPPTSPEADKKGGGGGGGLRELRLVRSNSSTKPTPAPTFGRRSSSLGIQSLLTSTEGQAPAPEDALLLELVAAKTAEAMAKQEAEEAKAKLEALRRVLTGSATAVSHPTPPPQPPPPSQGLSGFPFLSSNSSAAGASRPGNNSEGGGGGGGGWFGGGWGVKRAVTSADSGSR